MTLPEVLAQQAPHPVYPRLTAEPDGDGYAVRVGSQEVRMGWNELLQTLADREQLIDNERTDPYN
jgi:hypothetical protein